MSSMLLPPPPRLTVVAELRERCDRCDAAAKLTFQLPTGGELVFCGHHANRHTEDILRAAKVVVIENGFLWQGANRVADAGSQTFRVKVAVDNGESAWPAGLKVAVMIEPAELPVEGNSGEATLTKSTPTARVHGVADQPQ